ncbi:hypothetical protein ASPVEDRAFT_418764 [Aspergillus versicolor CBS 583.65]|uniref:Uncharacterized protein n=1 Tax=Aspergillus versicolor CBS 583.65 TaxID=1036611 RepID=A0A1L9Q4Z0_ASPVE|nr:uncharacterized protein ASPVEDRAFT_418764 [Aspergillus versicolor CBS 583.65]OJJ08845.1 hypothetical protein ASPVEDRAFT_418764 [Aspergillus versicolor CBS 583.65]
MGFKYSPDQCNSAINGEAIPVKLGGCHLFCVIRGIRYHHGFGTELRGRKVINRALNARSIMSNIIPDMTAHDDMPYCIWHPDVAAEETYRKLAAQYPQMRYQVGRACAVAGYVDLYKELNLLPDVHIAEEARDNRCTVIYDLIMGAEAKYDVMNDYNRTVNLENPPKSYLNGETQVCSMLEVKHAHEKDWQFGDSFCYFNITEDMNIDSYTTHGDEAITEDVTPFLYAPLPVDLPTVNKDLLILTAAYYGDIDRYVRLRRPMMIYRENVCVVRGIFHNTMFAKWWSLQDLTNIPVSSQIEAAISARFIMNNDLSYVLAHPRATPDCIWYPNVASWSTYLELAKRIPDMAGTVARACIVANLAATYRDLPDFKPSWEMVLEAKECPDPFFLEDLKRRAGEHGIDPDCSWPQNEPWRWDPIGCTVRQVGLQRPSLSLYNRVDARYVVADTDYTAIYNGYCCSISQVEAFVCAPEDWRNKRLWDIEDLYKDAALLDKFQQMGL